MRRGSGTRVRQILSSQSSNPRVTSYSCSAQVSEPQRPSNMVFRMPTTQSKGGQPMYLKPVTEWFVGHGKDPNRRGMNQVCMGDVWAYLGPT